MTTTFSIVKVKLGQKQSIKIGFHDKGLRRATKNSRRHKRNK